MDLQASINPENIGGAAVGLAFSVAVVVAVILNHRQVARDVGCSRPTVARWRKRFQEQGQFPAPQEKPSVPIPNTPASVT